jgi:hypothetical protein
MFKKKSLRALRLLVRAKKNKSFASFAPLRDAKKINPLRALRLCVMLKKITLGELYAFARIIMYEKD